MSRFRSVFAFALLLLAAGLAPPPASAQWSHDPSSNLTLPDPFFPGTTRPQVCRDASTGRLFAAATRYKLGPLASRIVVYALTPSGTTAPGWPTNGVVVCDTTGSRDTVQVVPDGANGCFLAWQDGRGAITRIFASHVLANGTVDPNWTHNGVQVTALANGQLDPKLAFDGSNLFIQFESIFSPTDHDIWVQALKPNGITQPGWSVNGVTATFAGGIQTRAQMILDGAGGVISTWEDHRVANIDIYAQRLNAAASEIWLHNGAVVCGQANNQFVPVLASDAAGGAIVGWEDTRNGTVDIYVQRVAAANGAGQWTADGNALCLGQPIVTDLTTCQGPSGGAYFVWADGRAGSLDIYGARVLLTGIMAPGWPVNGLAFCVLPQHQEFPIVTPDGSGGIIAAWGDHRNDPVIWESYATRVTSSGTLASGWPANGVQVALASGGGDAVVYSLVADGSGGVVTTFAETFFLGYSRFLVQNVDRYGKLGDANPKLTSLLDVPSDQGGKVRVNWSPTYLDTAYTYEIANYDLWRRVPGTFAAQQMARGAKLLSTGEAPGPGSLRAIPDGVETAFWQFVVSVPGRGLPGYSYDAPTFADSTGAGRPYTTFFVDASDANFVGVWSSAPDSGYSVDNLGPAMPAPFLGAYAAGTSSLHWGPNHESDLAGYRLYRGTTPGFPTDVAHFVAAPVDTEYADAAGSPYYYKLAAVDLHGNVSPFAFLAPTGTTDVGASSPIVALALGTPAPSPASGATRLRFALSRAGSARLSIFDVGGRRVRALVDGTLAAGPHDASWNLRGDDGHTISSGVYFVRLEAESRVLERRLVVVR